MSLMEMLSLNEVMDQLAMVCNVPYCRHVLQRLIYMF